MTEWKKTTNDLFSLTGIFSGIGAYLIWGLGPIYWKELQTVPAFEIIMHRIVWSFVFLLILIIGLRHFRELISVAKKPKILLLLSGTSILVSSNWFVYIWAVNNGYILQASLGYYINPLVNIVLGMVFLKERLRRIQILAVLLALLGVVFLTVFYKAFPWISLTLALTFGFYALIRKTTAVSALVGLTVETLILSLPALVYLFCLSDSELRIFGKSSMEVDLLLIGTALVTAVPLLLFNMAAKRLMLATLGFLQYLAPTCMLLIGVFLWGETIVLEQFVSFCFIWIALLLYSFDSVQAYRKFYKRS